ncbi:hypothetical protein GCM10009853_093890 [Glycomyces scopariae]
MSTVRNPSRLIIAVALVLAVVVVLLAWWFTTADPSDDGASSNDPTASQVDETARSDASPTALAEPDLSDVQWTYDSGRVYPFSETAGPVEWSEGQPAAGFAHSPDGAILAAFHICTRTGPPFSPETRLATIDDQMTEGPSRDSFRTTVENSLGNPYEEPEDVPVISGYIVHFYSDAGALVEIAVTQGELDAAFMLEVEWDEVQEDWRLHPPANGEDWQEEFRQVPTLEAFTAWGP